MSLYSNATNVPKNEQYIMKSNNENSIVVSFNSKLISLK